MGVWEFPWFRRGPLRSWVSGQRAIDEYYLPHNGRTTLRFGLLDFLGASLVGAANWVQAFSGSIAIPSSAHLVAHSTAPDREASATKTQKG